MIELVKYLDEVDKKILSLLSQNARMSYTEIGEKLGLSPSAVRKRIERLIRDEIIERFTIVLNPKKMGRSVTAIVTISPSIRQINAITNAIREMEEVVRAWEATGKCGIICIVEARDLDHLREVIDKIMEIRGVLAVDCCVALRRLK